MQINPISHLYNNKQYNRSMLTQKTIKPSFCANKYIVSKFAKAPDSWSFKDGAKASYILSAASTLVGGIISEKLGKDFLPESVNYAQLDNPTYGSYLYTSDRITFNSAQPCFQDLTSLQKQIKKHQHWYKPNDFSTNHPLHFIVHEFAHAAHWHHMEKRNGRNMAEANWIGLIGQKIPDAIGRLIVRFKLSDYAVDKHDMAEFMAERMTKDICKDWNKKDIYSPPKNIDLNYADIFDRKWEYRYSYPQSYVDYFTQQVWNGDLEGAIRAGELAEIYLQKIEALQTAPWVQRFADWAEGKFWLEDIAEDLVEINESITSFLDSKNQIKINKQQLNLHRKQGDM